MEFIHVSHGIPLDSTLATAAKGAAAFFIAAGFENECPTGFNFRLLDGTELFLTVQRRFPRRQAGDCEHGRNKELCPDCSSVR